MRIAIGADHGGFEIKNAVIAYLNEHNIPYTDYGTFSAESVDYPDYALAVAEAVMRGDADKGIVTCGTGIGISIAANKVSGIRCAVCHDLFTAEAAARHNDSNILAMGGRVIDGKTAVAITDKWLNTLFEGGRHTARLNKISEIENKYGKGGAC